MRVISQYRKYSGPTLQDHREMVLADGQKQVLQQGYSATPFLHGDLTEWERTAALDHWRDKFRGLTEGENPLWRLSAYDTDVAAKNHGWTPEEKKKFEDVLRNSPANGSDYIIVEQPKAPVPWPNYDYLVPEGRRTMDMVLKEIVEMTLKIGIPVDHVIVYERENLNRPDVIAALNDINRPEPVEELIQA